VDLPNLPSVFCDSDRVREVLTNLLMNAQKFTPSPGTISITAETPGPSDEFVKVCVIDTGIGIPKEHLTRIFQRFYQVDGSSTRKYGGTGLGLAIVKEIVESHGCKIYVESEENSGSKFTFTLPLHRQTIETSQTKAQSARSHHPSKLVEVVEDDVHVSTMIKMLLEDEGFSVIPARSGKDALTIAREHKPDIITLDIYLPDMNGFDLLQKLHTDPVTSHIPVVVLSILADKEKGDQLGVFDYLEKPIDVEKLHQILRKASDAIDAEGSPLRIMVVDDDASTLEFFEDCLTVEGYEVCTVQGGADVLRRAKAENPALILLDLIMPDIEGLDVLRQLKGEIETRDIPVIVLTGKAGLQEQSQSMLMGAESVIAKPTELRSVIDQVKKYFGAV
jgi:CheY-like chemotaxis protein/anti-sigma regulatory factor (Ser/Thr protein kinase)